MQKIRLYLMISLLAIVFSCSEDLDQYESDNSISKIEKEVLQQNSLYASKSFDAYVELFVNNSETYSNIPTSVLESIKDNFPSSKIDKIVSFTSLPKENYKHYSIFLDKGIEAVVFQWGHLLTKATIEDVISEREITAGEMTFKALLMLYESYESCSIEEVTKKDDEVFEIDFKDGTRALIDKRGRRRGDGRDNNGDDDRRGGNIGTFGGPGDDNPEEDGIHINPGDLPQVILNYVASNYTGHGIVEAEIYPDRYEVELSNGVKLEFDLEGNFIEASGGNGGNGGNGGDDGEGDGEDIDPASLPQSIQIYIANNYPDATIIGAEIDPFGYEVTLSNGLKLEFDLNGVFIEISGHSDDDGDDDSGDDIPIDPSELPQAILDYIALNYPTETIVRAELDASGYDVILSNGLKLEFSIDGVFIEISGGGQNGGGDDDGDFEDGEDIDPGTLPQAIVDFLASACPNETIIRAEFNSTIQEFEVTLSNGLKMSFDADGEFLDISGSNCENISISSLPQNILDYIASEFTSAIDKAKICSYGYRVDLENDTRIYFKVNGDVILVETDA